MVYRNKTILYKKAQNDLSLNRFIINKSNSIQESNISQIEKPIEINNNINNDLKPSYQQKFQQAVANNKIFTIHGGHSVLRRILLKRGWIEKLSIDYMPHIQSLPHEILEGLIRSGNIYETVAMSRLACNLTPKFIWQRRKDKYNKNNLINSYHNRIKRSDNYNFTTKYGINTCIENSTWHIVKGLSEILAPRFHCISNPDEYLSFLRDYRTTYCCSFIKYICDGNTIDLFSKNGEMPLTTVDFAINRINQEILIRTSTDINFSINRNSFGDERNNHIDDIIWKKFFSNVNLLMKNEIKICALNVDIQNQIRYKCCELIDNFKKFCPLLTSEGYKNLWILKPGFSSRGHGIYIKHNFNDIVNYVKWRPEKKYILQKYIEEPLLIYKTKFDIRQHILLTIVENKFNIWIYKDCYLRFCSHEYQLDDLNESIHIPNHSVQKKYQNSIKRSSNLPKNNMWLLKDFQKYLKSIKKSDLWEYKIYPGIKKNIIGVVMASLDETELVNNNFDLYGCDFILNKYYDTILIEINSSPDMSSTTKVTSRICPSVLNDLIKVVIDYPDNHNTDIGQFDLIYSIDIKTKISSNINNHNNHIHKNNSNNNNVKISVIGKSANIIKTNHYIDKISTILPIHIQNDTNNEFTKFPNELKNIIRTKPAIINNNNINHFNQLQKNDTNNEFTKFPNELKNIIRTKPTIINKNNINHYDDIKRPNYLKNHRKQI